MCAESICVGGDRDDEPCEVPRDCLGAICVGPPGCYDPDCCDKVCNFSPGFPLFTEFCCGGPIHPPPYCGDLADELCGPPYDCPGGGIETIDPANGVVDAATPYDPIGPGGLARITTITVTGPPDALASCWSLCETNASPLLHPPYSAALSYNEIIDVVESAYGRYTLTLLRPPTPGEITTVAYNDHSGGESYVRVFAHPGDVNGNHIALANDVDELMNILRGVADPRWGAYSADIDRSGAVAAPDLLALIDLLNGAGGQPPWLFTSVPTHDPECP